MDFSICMKVPTACQHFYILDFYALDKFHRIERIQLVQIEAANVM